MTTHPEAFDRAAPLPGTPQPRETDPAYHVHRARVLRSQGARAEAEAAYREALRLAPEWVEAHNELGTLLWEQQRLAEARACHLAALRLRPDCAETHNHLGNILSDEGTTTAAIQEYRQALQLDPNYGPARCNLANTLALCGWTEEALAEFEQARQIAPRDADLIVKHGSCLQTQGRLDEAIAAYRTALGLNDQDTGHHSILLYALNYHPDSDASAVLAEHRAWARRHADPLLADGGRHTNDRTPGRRLRVGYVSSQFRSHAVSFFSEPILASHDHRACEVFCYSAALPSEADATTRRLRGYADQWREIAGCGDEQVGEMIRADRIDILVDLCGHIGGNRLLVFARKPAPVQVTYLGYQNTTGMLAMDYRLTDAWSDPPGATDHLYTEKLVRLPRAFFCYLPSADAPAVTPLPAIANGLVTFGSFNHFGKVTPQVLATWAEILAAVPQSRLVLLAPVTASLRRRVAEEFERHGVRAARVELASRRPRADYLKLIGRVDIALDPFPFNGHTTTCDCLWQGVPVVTLSGDRYAARFGGSALVNLGLREWIASTRAAYIEIARGLAADAGRLKEIRATLRAKMLNSPLLDAAGFTRNLEAAYRQMWTDWCAQQPA